MTRLRFLSRPAIALPLILLIGLALRLALAWHHGYEFDIATNQGWGKTVVLNGLSTSYTAQVDNTMIPNYPPFSLMIFGADAWVYYLLNPSLELGTMLFRYLIKLPAIFADLGAATALFFLFRKLRSARTGLLAALIFVLNPAVWFNSAVWGQTDSMFSLFAFLAVLALVRKQLWLGGILVALTVLTKVQGIIFLPVFFLLAIAHPKHMYKPVLSGLATTLLIMAPFILMGHFFEVVNVFTSSVGFYPTLGSNGYNFWWSMFMDSTGSVHDEDFMIGFITYRTAALTMVAICYAIVCWRLWRVLRTVKQQAQRTEAAIVAAGLCALAFFVFSTQMHERYLFPFIVFGSAMAFLRRGYAMPFALLSVCFFFNLAGVLPYTPVDKIFFQLFPAWDGFIASLTVFCCVLLISRSLSTSLKPAKALRWRLFTPYPQPLSPTLRLAQGRRGERGLRKLYKIDNHPFPLSLWERG